MHPNTFLRTFWRAEVRPEVFVAMSFDPVYRSRFSNVIEPAVQANSYQGRALAAKRVDLSRTGDSILTDIIDGIAHSAMVLCDVSTFGNDSRTGLAYRSGNVMYEVGLALASRHSSEVLLIRDDKAPFLFDVSTVPHKHVDFSDAAVARNAIATELEARLNEIDHINDARLKMAAATLTPGERDVLVKFSKYSMGKDNAIVFTKPPNLALAPTFARLLDKQLIRATFATPDGKPAFQWTALGQTLALNIEKALPVIRVDVPKESPEDDVPPHGEGDAS